MKTTLIYALALVSLLTACHSTDAVMPRPTANTYTTATTDGSDTTQYQTDSRSTGMAAKVAQSGTPGATLQPTGRAGLTEAEPEETTPAAGPVTAVMPADTLARVK